MSNNDIKINCPRCDQQFKMSELFEHNSDEYNKFINAKVEKELLEKVQVEKEKMASDFERAKEIELERIKNELNKQKNDFEKKLLVEKNEKIQLAEKEKLTLAARLESFEKSKEIDLEKIKNQLNKEKNDFERSLIAEQNQKIQFAEKTALALQAKLESFEKSKEIEVEAIKNQLNKEKNDFEKKMLNEQNEKIQVVEKNNLTLEAKIESLEKSKDLEVDLIKREINKNWEIKLLEQSHEMIKPYLKQIEELKIANATNKLIHTKTKGENFEQEVESELIKAFGFVDKIEKITTGDTKADFLQVVKDGKNELGKIVYEVKNAKWSDAWVPKLYGDSSKKAAKYGILVAASFREKHGFVPFVKSPDYDNIWITDNDNFIFVAQILRKMVEIEGNFHIYRSQISTANNDQKVFQLEKIQAELNNFVTSKLGVFIKDFDTQMRTLTKVRSSLARNSNDIEKVEDKLKRKMNSSIIKELEKISGKQFVYDDDDELTG